MTSAAATPAGLTPDVAVIIVTYNSARVVGDLLDSLPAALSGVAADVVVVDNASADGTADLVEARGDCRVVRAANTGYAAGINRGVAQARPAAALLILNPDLRLLPGAVPPLLNTLRQPGVGIVAPQVRSPSGALVRSLRREPSLLRELGLTKTGLPWFSEYLGRRADYARPRTVDWALGAVLMMSRACWETLGGWDESFFLYSEETDVALRARDAGLATRYQPDAVAVHIGGGSGTSPAIYAMQVVNRVRLYRRRHAATVAWLYYGLVLAHEMTRVLRGRRYSWSASVALLRPARRPAELGCGDRLMPR